MSEGIISITVKTEAGSFGAVKPSEHATSVHCNRTAHNCKVNRTDRLVVRGGEVTIGHDTYTAPCQCCDCDEIIGTLVVKVSTIFGIEEDARVLNGRYRVY